MNKANDRASGFTLLELLVIIFIVIILAWIGMRTYNGAREGEREAQVRLNMRVAQIAAESYAADAGGTYPPASNDPAYLSYFPGGSADQKGTKVGKFPVNPFTDMSEAPQAGGVADVQEARAKLPGKLGQPGQIFYSPIAGVDGTITSYAIEGVGKNGLALPATDGKGTLVLSNQ